MRRIIAALLAMMVVGCNVQNEVVVEPTLAQTGEYSRTIQPIFDRSCGTSSCHGGGPNGFAGGLNLTSYDGLMRGSRYGTVVVSGNAFMSHLVQSINPSDTVLSPVSSVQMPAGRSSLARHEIQTVVNWIQRGARNDDGTLPFPEPRPQGKVFFTSQDVDLVGVIDRASNLIMRYVTVGQPLPATTVLDAPHNVQIDDQGRYYYVTMIRGGKLRKYDAASNLLLGEASVPTSPAHVVVTADRLKAYVTDFDVSPPSVGQVYVINTASMTVTKVIRGGSLMKSTHGARLSHDGKFLYAASNGRDMLHIISTDRDSLIANIPIASDVPPIGSAIHKPYQLAVRSDDRFIYATLNGTGRISIFERNLSNDSFRLVSDSIRVGVRPLQCEVTPDRRYLYVCNQGSGTVSVIDAQSNQFLTTIVGVGVGPHGIDISDDSRTVYVTCENKRGDPPHHPVTGSTDPGFLVYIDVATQSVVKRIEVGGFAAGVSVFPGKGN